MESAHSRIDEAWAPAREVTGKSLEEFLALFRGGAALTVRMINPAGMPDMALAVDMGESRREILALAARLADRYEEATGLAVESRQLGEVEARLWPSPLGPVFQAEMGGHLLLVTSPDLLRAIDAAFRGGSSGEALGESRFYRELSGPLGVNDRQFVLALNLEAIRGTVFSILAMSGAADEIRPAVQVSGLGYVTSLGVALGFQDGGAEVAVHLGTRDGARGVFDVLATAFPPLGDAEAVAVARRIPASAHTLQACRFAPGRALRKLDRLLRSKFPEMAEELDGAYARVREFSGISLEEDVFALGDLTVFSASVSPPAGGFFDDSLCFVRSEAMAPYWQVVRKVARALGSSFEHLEVRGGRVEYVHLTSGSLGEGGLLEKLLAAEGGELGDEDALSLVSSIALPAVTLARLETSGGWTVLSGFPQSLVRYAEFYAQEKALGPDAPLVKLLRRQADGKSAVAVFKGGRAILSLYNTLLSLANGFAPLLSQVGVDLARAPPGEVFLGDLRSGHVSFAAKPSGFTLRCHRLTAVISNSSSALLVTAGAVAVVAGMVVPALMRARTTADTVTCMANLRGLHSAAFIVYAQKEGHFPHDPDGPLASLQIIVDRSDGSFDPENFVCPEGHEIEAIADDGKLVLTEDTCSYEMVPWRLRPTDPGILIYEKAPYHDGSRFVVDTKGYVFEMSESEFQERFAKERQRYGKKKARTKKSGKSRKRGRRREKKD
ncbi:MAG: hypothetical protein O7J95_02970 [Planctomycetota bacterium]|nr:hypothetical protein [Planctomycetota bacterium]